MIEEPDSDPADLGPPVTGKLVDAPPHRPLISWAVVMLGLFGAVVVYLFTSIVVAMAAWLLLVPDAEIEMVDQAIMENRLGFALVVLIPQLSLILLPLLAAALNGSAIARRLAPTPPQSSSSPTGTSLEPAAAQEWPLIRSATSVRVSLGLVRGWWPLWAWLAAAMAAPFIGLMTSQVVGEFFEESESLREMTETFRQHARSGFLIPVALLIGLVPAVCEEVLFRGFLLRRLARLSPHAVAIASSSIVFALFHIDPVHVVSVLPLGFWLGYVALRSGSVLPAMLAHLVNNVAAVLSVLDPSTGMFDMPSAFFTIPIVSLGIVGTVGTLIAARRYRYSA